MDALHFPTYEVCVWSRDAIRSTAIIGGTVALVLVAPFCVVPILDLFAIPACLVAEYVLIAGLVARVSNSARPPLLLAAAAVAVVCAHVLVFCYVLPWVWVNPLALIVAPILVVGLAVRRTQSPRLPLLLATAGVVLAMVALGVELDLTASLLLASQRAVAPPMTWGRDLSIGIGVDVAAVASAWIGLSRAFPRLSAVRLVALIAGIPVVGCGCLAVFVWAFNIPLSA